MIYIVLKILAGLFLFLLAIHQLSRTLLHTLGDTIKTGIQKFTTNTFTSLLTGLVSTALLDSSSAVIIIVIIFINNKILTFKKAMGIVLGANIGTTISSQLFALNLDILSLSMFLLGIIFILIFRQRKHRMIGKIILLFGVLFFGIYLMEYAVEPLRQNPYFNQLLLKETSSPISAAIVGAFLTLIMQSSSATVAMTMVFAKHGLLSVYNSVAIMIGAELGTCSDTLIATIKGSRQAIKTGLFHLSFNIASIILGLLFFNPFVNLVLWFSKNTTIQNIIANAHLIFNIGGVILFIWTIPLFEKGLNYILPEKKDPLAKY